MKLRTKSVLFFSLIMFVPLTVLFQLLCVRFDFSTFFIDARTWTFQDEPFLLMVLFLTSEMLLITCLAWLFNRSTEQRIMELTRFLDLMFKGEGPTLKPDKHQDEITELGLSFVNLYEQKEMSRVELEANFSQLQISNMKVEEKYAQAYTLQLIQDEISHELDTDKLLKKTADIVIGVLGCKHCSIYLLDDRNRQLTMRAVSGASGNVAEQIPVEADHLLARVFRDQAIYTDQNSHTDQLPNDFKNFTVIPLISRRGSLGVMLLEQETGCALHQDLLDFARLISQELSSSVENASLYAKMKHMATHDDLTGIFNRMYLMNYMEELFASQPKAVGVILLDVDHFKLVNDQFGHLVGDAVLKTLANVIQSKLPTGILARYGGEEFVIVLPGVKPEESFNLAEWIRLFISQFRFSVLDGTRIPVTISAGLACYPMVSDNYEKLLLLADEALYEAKNSGRNRVCMAAAEPVPVNSLGLFETG